MNIQKMMKQAQAMQQKIADLQGEMERREITGTAGGGLVSVTITGKGQMLRLSIDDKAMDDKAMLEDLVVAAHNDASGKRDEAFSEEMGKATSGMGLPAGMKLPF